MASSVELLPGNAEFITSMDLMKIRCSDFLPAFAIIDSSFMVHEAKKWATLGPGWAPLADSTMIRKEGLSDQTMVRGEPGYTENLRLSLTSHSAHSLYTVTPLTLTMGTDVSYAHWHQGGTDHMPVRHVVDNIDTARGLALARSWLQILQIYVVNGAAAAASYGAAAGLA